MATYTPALNGITDYTIQSLAINDIINATTAGIYNVILPPGTYGLACWGARGGTAKSLVGGYGGYSYGDLTLDTPTSLYLYVGGKGTDDSNDGTGSLIAGGFNGGGQSRGGNGGRASGGGATDIRIGSDSLYARVIVAGGGGGAYYHSSSSASGGAGGGTTGGGAGGSQTAGGSGDSNGSFGYGGSISSGFTIAGGGGGWYGGAAANPGGGGSGYVYTAATASYYPSGCELNSSYYLASASTSAYAMTTNSGNGRIQITIRDLVKNKIYIKTSSTTWKPASKIYVKTAASTWKEGSL